MIESVEQFEADQMSLVGDSMMSMMSIDPADTRYQSFRSKTTLSLEVASLVTGGYGAVKGAMAFNKLARMPGKITKMTKLGGNGFSGRKGFEFKNARYQKHRNIPTEIRGRFYSGHALDQMQNRGFTPSIIEEIAQNGSRVVDTRQGTVDYYDAINNIKLVLNTDGEVVTIFYKSPYK